MESSDGKLTEEHIEFFRKLDEYVKEQDKKPLP